MNGVVLLDLKIVFDTVDHAMVLTNLKHIGLGHTTIDWFKSYLSSRTQTCLSMVCTRTKRLSLVVSHKKLFFVLYAFWFLYMISQHV